MKIVIYFAFIVCFSQCNFQGSNNTKNKDAHTLDVIDSSQVKWVNDNQNFGTYKEGDVVEIAFQFHNTSNKPLILSNVQPSCGCTIAEYPKEAFGAQQKGKITVKYNSKNRPKGLVHKTVQVYGNFSSSPKILSFQGTIK